MVPDVPTPLIKISIFPSVCFQISGPVVSLCTYGFAKFWNYYGMNEFGVLAAISFAFFIHPEIPLEAGVIINSAPKDLIITLLSKPLLYLRF